MKTFERDGMTHVVYYDAEGRRQRRSLNVPWGDTIGTAKALTNLFANGSQPATSRTTLEAIYNRALTSHYADHKDLKGVREKWRNDVSKFFGGDTPIAEITSSSISDFRAWCLAGGEDADKEISPKTVNRKVALISKLLHLAVEWEVIDKVPVMKRYKERRGRIRWLTDAEEATALAFFAAGAGGGGWGTGFRNKADPNAPREGSEDFADLLPVLLDTGLRLGEALKAQDRDITPSAIHIWDNKGDRPRTIPLTSRASAILQRRARRDAVAHAKLAGSSQPFGNLTGFRCSKLWALLRAAMNLEGDDEFVIHAIRHTFAVRMVEEGEDIRVIQELMGHAKIETTMVYAHVSRKATRGAIDRLERRAKDVPEASTVLRVVEASAK